MTNGVEVFLRWLKAQSPGDRRARMLRTLVLFVVDDVQREAVFREKGDIQLDEQLLDELFGVADAREVANLLTYRFGRDLSPELFQRVYERALASAPDQNTRAALLFVAAQFLRLNPKSFQLSEKLVDELKDSDDVDHRLAAITAIRHTAAPVEEVLTVILTALKKDIFEDKHSGLNQLVAILETDDWDMSTAPAVVDAIKIVLRRLSESDPDVVARRAADHMLALLQRRQSGSR